MLPGARISRAYDLRHRELSRNTASGNENTTTTYYPDGQVSTLTAANPGTNPVTTTYTYNRRGLLTREVLEHNATTAWTFDYAYNLSGHLSSQTYPGNLVVGYAPDGLGRPTQAGTFATQVKYYPNGAMSGFKYGNGVEHSMTQNERKLPSNSHDVVKDANGIVTATILNDAYTYDANGNVLSLTDASNAPTADNRTWGTGATTLYDGLDRLLSVRGPTSWGALTGNYNAIYSYDPLDNLRTNRLGAAQLTYGYDSTNRLATLSYNGGAAQAVSSDVRGNITANAYRSQAYQFDLAHRMNAVTGQESYLYDGHGRRARTLNLQTGTIEYFGYGKDGRLLQDWSNRRQVRNGYIYLGNTLVGLYEVNLTNGTITPKYQHTDALGSPVVTTNASKTVLSRMSYTPYGQPTMPMDGVGYTGHFVDVGTQLTYMQQRYYDPQLGRFLSIDPLFPSLKTGYAFNRFAYALNNPLLFVDPDGRKACPKSGCTIDGVSQPPPEPVPSTPPPAPPPPPVTVLPPVNVPATLPSRDAEALALIFDVPVDRIQDVNIVQFSVVAWALNARATTAPNVIYLEGSIEEFLAAPTVVLEEYFHVIEQFGTGFLQNRGMYMLESARAGLTTGSPYRQNVFEKEAKKFAGEKTRSLKKARGY